jgi:hypothetical protein
MKAPTMIAVAFKDAKPAKKSRVVAVDSTPETAAYKEPSPSERMVSRAHDAKVRATGDWVEGHITSKKHSEIHKRADKVIKAKGRAVIIVAVLEAHIYVTVVSPLG